jgi:hypothetical protein
MDPDVMSKIAERKIQEAIEEGKFDDLPGKGKPIIFDDDPMTPPHLRMANKILRNAGVLPEWIQVQKEIETERKEAAAQRTRLIQEHQSRRARMASLPADHPEAQTFAAWHARSRAAYLRRLKGVNTAILKFNIIAPSTTTVYVPYKVEAEMAAFDAEFPPLAETAPVVQPLEPQPKDNLIQGIARTRYQEGEGGVPPLGLVRMTRLLGQEGTAGVSEETEPEDVHRADMPKKGKYMP